MKTTQKPLFSGYSPCGSCPYRIDTELQIWDRKEFSDLLKWEKDQLGRVYHCHKRNGSVCKGWLIDQDKRNFPSIMLRISLAKHQVTREYLDKLYCKIHYLPIH